MRKKNANKLLLTILLILIIITTIIIVLYLKNNANSEIDENQNKIGEAEVKYDNEEVSYYNYIKGGLLDIDIEQYVKLPENYLEYQITEKTQEEINTILGIIVENSEVEIPKTLLNGYYGDIYNSVKLGAQTEGKELNDYIKEIYGYDNYEKYIEENKKNFEEDIKKDLVYQAISKDLNISVTRDDIENYFSERIQNGETYEDLVETYGEQLMYKYTIQDKIEKELIQKLSK